MRGQFLLLVLVFGAGLGLGYLAQPEPVDRARSNPAPAAPAEGSNDTPLPTLKQAIDALPIPERLAEGDGTITGRVFDQFGQPVVGAVVVGIPEFPRKRVKWRKAPSGPPANRDYEKYVRETIWRWRRSAVNRIETQVGPDGAYCLEGLSASRYSVSVYAEGLTFRAGGLASPMDPFPRSQLVSTGGVLDFVGQACVEVPVEVRYPAGTAPRSASIRTKQPGRSTTVSWYPADAWIELAPGEYEIWAESDDGAESKSPAKTITIRADETPETVLLELESRSGIRLNLRYPGGHESLRPYVEVLPIDEEGNIDFAEGRRGPSMEPAREQYVWTDLEPGQYRVGAAWFKGGFDVSEDVEVAKRIVQTTLSLPLPRPQDHLLVRLLDPAREPLLGARFSVMRRQGNGSSRRGVRTVRRPDGAFLVDDTVPAGESGTEGARYTLGVTHREYGKIERDFRPGSGELLELRFLRPASLTVGLEGLTGHRLDRKLRVELKPHGPPPWVTYSLRSDRGVGPDGTRQLGPVQPGRYDVRISCDGGAHGNWVLVNRTVDLRSGGQQIELPAPVIHALTVHCPGSDPGKGVQLERLGKADSIQNKVHGRLGANRKCRFIGFPAGKYLVWYPSRDGRTKSTELDLPGPSSLTLE